MENKNNSKHSEYYGWKVIQTGIAGGTFLFLFSWLSSTFHFLNFSLVSSFSFFHSSAFVKHIIAVLLTILISIVLALLYYALLRKRKPFLTGIIVGIFLFSLMFWIISQDFLSLITVFCLLLCYSLFISMSVSWIDERGR